MKLNYYIITSMFVILVLAFVYDNNKTIKQQVKPVKKTIIKVNKNRYFLIVCNYSNKNQWGNIYYTNKGLCFPSKKDIEEYCEKEYKANNVVITNIVEFKDSVDWHNFNYN